MSATGLLQDPMLFSPSWTLARVGGVHADGDSEGGVNNDIVRVMTTTASSCELAPILVERQCVHHSDGLDLALSSTEAGFGSYGRPWKMGPVGVMGEGALNTTLDTVDVCLAYLHFCDLHPPPHRPPLYMVLTSPILVLPTPYSILSLPTVYSIFSLPTFSMHSRTRISLLRVTRSSGVTCKSGCDRSLPPSPHLPPLLPPHPLTFHLSPPLKRQLYHANGKLTCGM
jgi:hypothetical protein